MKLKILVILFSAFLIFGTTACNRSGCPGIDKKTGEFKSKKNKTKSGLFPKKM